MGLSIDPLSWARLQHGDETSFIDFLGHHELQHREFDVLIRRLGGAPFASLPLAPAPLDTWLLGEEQETPSFYPGLSWHQIHQVVHEGEASSLLIASPPDFTSYDLNDPDELATWAFTHSLEHVRLRQALGI